MAKLCQDQQDSARQLGGLFRPLRPLTPPLASRERKRPEKIATITRGSLEMPSVK